MIQEIALLVLYIGADIISMGLFLYIFFGIKVEKSKLRRTTTLILFAVFHIWVLFFYGYKDATGISIISLLLLFLMLLKPKKRVLALYIFVYVCVAAIVDGLMFLLGAAFHISEQDVYNDDLLVVLCQMIPTLILIGMFFYQKVKKTRIPEVRLDWRQYVVFYALSFSAFMMIGALIILTRNIKDAPYLNWVGIGCAVACITFVVVTIWSTMVINSEMRLKEEDRAKKQYIELQKVYYEQLLDQERGMETFRHDMRGHFIRLEHLCKDGNLAEIEDYLQQMHGESAVDTVKKYSGNRDVDALISGLARRCEQSGVIFEFQGMLPSVLAVNSFDLVTVVWNVLENAIEACERLPDSVRRHIRVTVGTYGEKVYFVIENTASRPIEVDHHFQSGKKEAGHGLGLENTDRIISKYGGYAEYKYVDGYFTSNIIL